MQNTVYECKQNGEVFFSSLCVTSFRFGNYPDNSLVTEQPQYWVNPKWRCMDFEKSVKFVA